MIAQSTVPAGKLGAPDRNITRDSVMDREMASLWKAYHEDGDETARDRIVERNLPLVHHIAHRIRRGLRDDVEYDDLLDAGCIGLLQAVDAYDAGRGLAFNTFAYQRIRGAILDDLRKADLAGRDTRRRQRMIASTERQLEAENAVAANAAQVAQRMNTDIETLHRWKAAVLRTMHVSLDERVPGTDRHGPSLGELVAGVGVDDIENRISFSQESEAMRREFLRLTDRERTVLMLYYYDELKVREIAEVLGVTESRVSQIRTRALQTLRLRLEPLR